MDASFQVHKTQLVTYIEDVTYSEPAVAKIQPV